jgi:signal transduction histidine kinase
MFSGRMPALGKRLNGEVVASRLLAAVVAACLAAAAAALVGQPNLSDMSYPQNWVVAVVCCLLGLRVIAHTRRNAVGWVVLVMGVCGAVAVGAEAWPSEWWTAWIGTWVAWPSYSLLPVAILIFPTGRLLSAWWWPALAAGLLGVLLPLIGIGWASWTSPATFWEDVLRGSARRGLPLLLTVVGGIFFALSLLGAVIALVVRCFRATGNQRRLLLWTIFCTALMLPALAFDTVGTGWWAWVVVATAFPVAAVIAILRYGLYDIDLLIHRTLLYGLLASVLIAVYAVVVVVATMLTPAQAHVIGTVVVVMALAPMHQALRARLDHWLYGDRADPYRALSRLGEQLENPLRPGEVFPAVAKSVREALKLPYVAICLDTSAQSQLLAEHGHTRHWPQLKVPMRHGGKQVGELVAEARAPEEGFGRRERRLLADLARQSAPAAQAARLAQDLQCADERFEREREEHLQQLTHDLHDGVGPGLTGIRMQVDAIRKLVGGADPRVDGQLDRAIKNLKSISSQVRELVSNVPPRDLHLGLLHAVRELAERFENSLTLNVTAHGEFDQVPGSVTLAAYRIIGEALTNVARHANANSCQIHLSRTEDLEVRIVDDGDGISPNVVPGVGLASMRKRCEDLGGQFIITSLSPGTEIMARFPLGDS